MNSLSEMYRLTIRSVAQFSENSIKEGSFLTL